MLEEPLFFLLSTDYTDYPDEASAHSTSSRPHRCVAKISKISKISGKYKIMVFFAVIGKIAIFATCFLNFFCRYGVYFS